MKRFELRAPSCGRTAGLTFKRIISPPIPVIPKYCISRNSFFYQKIHSCAPRIPELFNRIILALDIEDKAKSSIRWTAQSYKPDSITARDLNFCRVEFLKSVFQGLFQCLFVLGIAVHRIPQKLYKLSKLRQGQLFCGFGSKEQRNLRSRRNGQVSPKILYMVQQVGEIQERRNRAKKWWNALFR